MFRSEPVQEPAPRKLLGIIYNEVTEEEPLWSRAAGRVCRVSLI